jgi:hypothetical protein
LAGLFKMSKMIAKYRRILTTVIFNNLLLYSILLGLISCKKNSSSRDNPDSPPGTSSSNSKLSTGPSLPKDCTPVESAETIEPWKPISDGNSDFKMVTFGQLSDAIRPHCSGCHQAPQRQSGGFSYADSFDDQSLPDSTGKMALHFGLAHSAERMLQSIQSGSMPPEGFRQGNEVEILTLKKQLTDWIDAKKPRDQFKTSEIVTLTNRKFEPLKTQSTDLGDCTPSTGSVGFDGEKDKWFDNLDTLPESLTDTDLSTFDTFELAKKGTVAYNTEYPLWADDAKKLRYVHFPLNPESRQNEPLRQAAKYDPKTREFLIPNNARFYKTFFKDVMLANGKVQQRLIETRIIVVRHAPRSALFGTYQWNDTQTAALLVKTPYRDGTPWKDVVKNIEVNEATKATRLYPIPGRQRCVDCHQGSDNFTLGFTPLQLNRRKNGEGGSERQPGRSEILQIDRLTAMGFLGGFADQSNLPKIETSGREPPSSLHALRAQGYFIGNCAHCHNPLGTALKDTEVKLDLSAGKLFPFVPVTPAEGGSLTFLGPAGNLSQSLLFNRISRSQNSFGKSSSPMPMHIAGGPDCRLLNLVGKWLKSFESGAAAETFVADCPKSETNWLELDFTSPNADRYLPRRPDWNSQSLASMPDSFKKLQFSEVLLSISRNTYPTGYFIKKSETECNFPVATLPTNAPLWADTKRNWGEAFYQTPGAFYYGSTCAHCHGRKGNGQSGLATSLLYYSNGAIQVANFEQGMFGNGLKNLEAFNTIDTSGAVQNLAPQYLVWMARQGTLFNFPGDLESYLGKGHANMLFSLGERCGLLLRPRRPGDLDPAFAPDTQINLDVCTVNNPITPQVGFDPEGGAPIDLDAQNAWKDKASYNAALSVFVFLKEQAFAPSLGFPAREKECEKVYPTTGKR